MIRRYRQPDGEAELEFMLRRADQAFMRLLRGQAGRYPVRRLESILRQQGFLPTQHFLDRLRERAQAQGIRFDPRTFASEFQRATHYRQTRPGSSARIAVMRGLPMLYRMGGERGNRVALVGVLPSGRLPPAAPARAPQLRQGEQMLSQRWRRFQSSGPRRPYAAIRARPAATRASLGSQRPYVPIRAAGSRRSLGGGQGAGQGPPPGPPPRTPPSGGGPFASGGRPDTLVVGRGRTSARSSVPDVGTPATMDFRSSTNPHYRAMLQNALVQFPELRGAFRDVFLERMGINPDATSGVDAIGVTPAGIRAAHGLLQPGGVLRILQKPADGQTWQEMGRLIQSMLSRRGFRNIQIAHYDEAGADHVLVTATRK